MHECRRDYPNNEMLDLHRFAGSKTRQGLYGEGRADQGRESMLLQGEASDDFSGMI